MLKPPTLLKNRYSILHVESTSDSSKVFFGLDTQQNPPRNCAIKAYKPIIQKPQITQWIEQEFYKEANSLQQLSKLNQHLPQIYNYFSNFQAYHLVRELVEGISLNEKVQNTGKFSHEVVRAILVELLPVLDYLHQKGVIHQNIKPKNIILRHDDNIPMLIDFGSIKQIVATFDFSENKPVFSLDDVYGYTPSEQSLGKSIPASDLYSLGLTAVYLLTAKNPVDLPIDLNSGNLQIPKEIQKLDSDLADIITCAISPNSNHRYASAQEMLKALSKENASLFIDYSKKSNLFQHSQLSKKSSKVTNLIQSQNIGQHKSKNGGFALNWWLKSIFVILGLYGIGLGLVSWYEWYLTRTTFVSPLPETPNPLPPKTSQLPAEPSFEKPLILNSQSKNLIEIPIFAVGTSQKELRTALGEPDAIQPGYWANSTAWIYQNQADGSIDLGYLFDINTGELRQTEMAIAPNVNLNTIQKILISLLEGNSTDSTTQELQKFRRQD